MSKIRAAGLGAALAAALGGVALSMAGAGALAQGPPGGAPAGPPGGFPTGDGDAGDDPSMFRPTILTPAQQIAASLPPPGQGLMAPLKPLGPGSPLPASDPRDFKGTWIHSHPIEFRIQKDQFGAPLPYTMAGVGVLERRLKAGLNAKPYANASTLCRPPGQPWQLDINFPFQIFQWNGGLEFVFWEYHGRWNIAFDPADLPAGPERAYMGRSLGHWEGDTLVVETSGFKQGLWFEGDGTPLSKDGRLVHRIRKVDNGDRRPYLEITTTVFDPIYYTNPWSIVRSYSWQPQYVKFNEYNCEEQAGDPRGGPDTGTQAEPAEGS